MQKRLTPTGQYLVAGLAYMCLCESLPGLVILLLLSKVWVLTAAMAT